MAMETVWLLTMVMDTKPYMRICQIFMYQRVKKLPEAKQLVGWGQPEGQPGPIYILKSASKAEP